MGLYSEEQIERIHSTKSAINGKIYTTKDGISYIGVLNRLQRYVDIPTPLTSHSELTLDDGTNPHSTTKADVGLGNVDNTADADKIHDNFSGLNVGDYKHLTSVEYDRFLVMPRTVLLNTEEDVYGMTGVASTAIVYSKLIPANTFEIGDLIKVEIRVRRVSAGTNNLQLRLSFSTSPTTTPTYLAIMTLTTAQNTGTMQRNIKVVSNTTVRTIKVGTSIQTDTPLTASTIGVETIPTITSGIYFNIRVTNGGGVLDTSYIDFIHVQIIKSNP